MSNYGCEKNKNDNKKNSPETFSLNNNNKSIENKIIINLSMVNFIDEFGVKCLEKILKDYKKDGALICLTN